MKTSKIKIPCHKVIRTDGTLSKYNKEIKKKKELLKKEGIILDINKQLREFLMSSENSISIEEARKEADKKYKK